MQRHPGGLHRRGQGGPLGQSGVDADASVTQQFRHAAHPAGLLRHAASGEDQDPLASQALYLLPDRGDFPTPEDYPGRYRRPELALKPGQFSHLYFSTVKPETTLYQICMMREMTQRYPYYAEFLTRPECSSVCQRHHDVEPGFLANHPSGVALTGEVFRQQDAAGTEPAHRSVSRSYLYLP